jgi:hypothetical protein
MSKEDDMSTDVENDHLETIAHQAREIEANQRRMDSITDDLIAARREKAQAEEAVYDTVMEELGLPRRVREYVLMVRVSYTQQAVVKANSQEAAEEMIDTATRNYRWNPGSPLANAPDITFSGYATSVEAEALDG